MMEPWHCRQCLHYLKSSGVRDLTLDRTLMKYLVSKVLPPSVEDHRRVKRAARFMYLDAAGKLWVKHPKTGVSLYVPPICKRASIVRDAMKQLGFPNG